ETGVKELANFDVSTWFGVFYPKSTPTEPVTALNEQIKILLGTDAAKKTIAAMGAVTDYGSPAQYQAFIEAETAKFKGIIDKEGLQMEVK
ncbi:MAG: tripartite tricarboxylate transporter substrate-binding protein, partial [Hyphomicrobiales bacterium]|nr:tripartite tricarboxylate transporter substrate-binding protein [Hyphomicrobiales bacterium]